MNTTTDINGFTVTANDITVYCGSGGASWGFICQADKCFTAVGWDDAVGVAAGAVTHLRWHANGKRECIGCGGTLTADDTDDRCAPGTCPELDEEFAEAGTR